MSLSTLYFFQMMIDNERWRYSYGRSCFASKLQNLKIQVPLSKWGVPDTEYIDKVMQSAEYWEYIENRFS